AGTHAGSDLVARFRSEAEAVARLQHPNIVQVHEVGEADGVPYFSLEFVDGGSLARYLKGVPQPPRGAASLACALAYAVHYAHQHGVVHRDLKPANILLATGGAASGAAPGTASSSGSAAAPHPREAPALGCPKIADFGLAKQLDDPSERTQS